MSNATYPFGEQRTAYSTLHWRLRAYRGPAKRLKCMHCAERGVDKRAMDWARLHETDGESIHDYIPLCRKCHIAYDESGHRVPHAEETKFLLSVKNSSYRHTPEAIEKIRVAARDPSAEARAKMAAGGRKSARMRRAEGPMPAEQRAKISAALKGNANAAGSSRPDAGGAAGKRTGQALENIRLGQQRRRQREREEREAGES